MSAVPLQERKRSIPAIWPALALSLLVHAVVLWDWHRQEIKIRKSETQSGSPPMRVRIVPRENPPPPAPQARAAPKPPPPRSLSKQAAKPSPPKAPEPPPPILAIPRDSPAPGAPGLRLPTPPAPPPPLSSQQAAPSPQPPLGDFSAGVRARQIARGQVPPVEVPESENARLNRKVTADLDEAKRPVVGVKLFRLENVHYDDAELLFDGWDSGPGARRRYDVRKGNYPDIRIAVVKKVVEIIRERINGDFTWESRQRGQNLTLSARPEDTAGLEDVIMKEMFEDGRSAR